MDTHAKVLHLGLRMWKFELFSIFQTVMDATPKVQSWKQFKGLNTRETTSHPAFDCEQIGSAFSQFLQQSWWDEYIYSVCINTCCNKPTQITYTLLDPLLTKLWWYSLEKKNNIPNKDRHHSMPETCSGEVLFLKKTNNKQQWEIPFGWLILLSSRLKEHI